ncbi:hypothetical protein Ahy_B06g081935 [Arachis hypogaea]|uniref:Uncharacterized protein n=1 Tax=Arachis hypogaea TaxID=3818 RepID=A0A444YMI2_ARAHY|nr:hypothetical protein Ahy_B06g081935 [Arachis hypogaea]
MYGHPWRNYKKISAKIREQWFQKWTEKFIWDKTHDAMIKKIFDHRMARQLQQMMEDLDLKKALHIHWETVEGFKRFCLMNKANRTLVRSLKYIGGSATFMKTNAKLSKSLSRDATMVETFKYTPTLKENKERFDDQRVVDHYVCKHHGESYTQRLAEATGDDDNNSASAEVDLDTVWHETTFEPYKNRTFIHLCHQPSRRSQRQRRFEGIGAGAHPEPSPTGSAATALNFIWDAEHDALIRKIYDHRMSWQLQQVLEDALLVHWKTDEGFKHQHLTNRVNGASVRSSKYTGGSAIFMKTKARLSKSLDRDATLAKTFEYTHTLKENKEIFAEQRSQDHYARVLHAEARGRDSIISAKRGGCRWLCYFNRRS